MKKVYELEFFGRTLKVEVGELAKQANGAVIVRYDDTVILSTACCSKVAKTGIDFFPLTVSFEEKLYSVGKIPGSFLRREGRPSEHAILTARIIDRPIRPLFDENFRNEVQIVNYALSVNPDVTPEMTALFGSSLALCISDIPFSTPVAGVKVGYIDNQFVTNPTREQMEHSLIDLTVAGTKEAINMVEAGAKEVSEELMLQALMYGHEQIKKLVAFEEKIIAEVGKEKMVVELFKIDEEIQKEVFAKCKADLVAACRIEGKLARYNKIDELTQAVIDEYEAREYESDEQHDYVMKQVETITHDIVKDEVRRLISVDKIRPDGRKLDEIRPLNSQVDILPRVHGSALFTRGETQVLSITTLGALGDQQILDNLNPDEELKRFMHHYNFPPFSVGEVGKMGNPGRREIGHGALGERSLLQVMPSEDEFPYTVRVVSEVLESNGSSSQASICAATMSLMAAGVPIKRPVAGVAMGLISTGDLNDPNCPYTILTDIQGQEDHYGDMDFKVSGTTNGITALQMDIKIKGITENIFKQALAQAHKGRLEILDNMMGAISEVRSDVSKYAPKLDCFNINPDRIRDVIGQGGKTINEIIASCDNVKIDISDEGRVVIYHQDREAINKAKDIILNIVKEAKVGEIYEASVVRIESYGAFVNLFKGCDALLHVSQIKHERVNHPKDVLKINDKVRVIVTEIDEKGRVNVSAKDLLPKPEKVEKKDHKEENK
ncbi:MAG: polyribonucleotide nucleotidyltransferase [Erysipelotrichaceae bacterium]|nr:polyribonucleotide nucleotidyltransferase [Erysipelotrichaceae bacterium]